MFSSIPTALLALVSVATAALVPTAEIQQRSFEYVIKPKVFIISLFRPEAEIWHNIPEFDILAMNITVPGFSVLFPDAHCTADGEICQLVTSMGEINAAITVNSLLHSSNFDLTSTYFMIAGIAGINPEVATIGSVAFARYAVQVALQHEIDIRDLPGNYSTGYIPIGSTSPSVYPSSIYGTEVFELNQNLQHMAAAFARNATLVDSPEAVAYRKNYISDLYAAARGVPEIHECDVATSDVYYSGRLLGEAFGNYTSLLTNGSAQYCTSAQEDNAVMEALLRGAASNVVDFGRIISMRSGSNFERPWLGGDAATNLLTAVQGGFEPAVENLYHAGIKVIEGILEGWNATFAKGVDATNYIGDILGTLGGKSPDFGNGDPDADIYARR